MMKITITILKGNAIAEKGKLAIEQGKPIVVKDRAIEINLTEPDVFIFGREGAKGKVHVRLRGDPYISRIHFLLEISPPRIFFRDLDEVKNPSFINGIPRKEDILKSGDIIEVGYTQLKVLFSEEDIEPYSYSCIKCGRPIEAFKEDVPSLCQICEEEERRKKSVKVEKVSEVCCFSCKRDLTDKANSDGRAKELEGLVRYYCRDCVNSLKKGDVFKKIGFYEVLSKLGEGGMAEVFMVYDPQTARVMALKQVLNIPDPVHVKRFEREIRYMRELIHPNVLRYIDSGISEGRPYLLTEMAWKGNVQDLFRYTTGGGVYYLSTSEAVYIVTKALEGLAYIHMKKIIHRDIKPENILLQEAPGSFYGYIPKIADFGISKKYIEVGGSILTGPTQKLGTIMFMAPEQIEDARNVREQADLYSMGVTLYYLLTGQYPYDFPSPPRIYYYMYEQRQRLGRDLSFEEAFKALLKEKGYDSPYQIVLLNEPIPIEEKGPIPPPIAKVVNKAISKNIFERFQSAVEFMKALLDAWEEVPIT
jgi:serine/threonine protein kinase